jgi:hypothetical protein
VPYFAVRVITSGELTEFEVTANCTLLLPAGTVTKPGKFRPPRSAWIETSADPGVLPESVTVPIPVCVLPPVNCPGLTVMEDMVTVCAPADGLEATATAAMIRSQSGLPNENCVLNKEPAATRDMGESSVGFASSARLHHAAMRGSLGRNAICQGGSSLLFQKWNRAAGASGLAP